MSKTPSRTAKDDFHRERSRLLDCFAGLEETFVRFPKATKDKLLADELKNLRSIRNDLVHSQLRFVQLEGQLHAVAINVQDSTNVARQARLLKLGDFEVLAVQVNEARRKIETAT
jgi:hypothetical protein